MYCWSCRKKAKNPLLRAHNKHKSSYFQMENSNSLRDSMASSFCNPGVNGSIDASLDNPFRYEKYLPNGLGSMDSSQTTLRYNGDAGLSRPPSLNAHEDALLFTTSQTNNNATLLRKSGNKSTENGQAGMADDSVDVQDTVNLNANNNENRRKSDLGSNRTVISPEMRGSLKPSASDPSLFKLAENDTSLDLWGEIMGKVDAPWINTQLPLKEKTSATRDSVSDGSQPVSYDNECSVSITDLPSPIKDDLASSSNRHSQPGMTSTPFQCSSVSKISGACVSPSGDLLQDETESIHSVNEQYQDGGKDNETVHYDSQISITLDDVQGSDASFVTQSPC